MPWSPPLGPVRPCWARHASPWILRQGFVHDAGYDYSRDECQRCDGADRGLHGEHVRQESRGDRAYGVARVAPQPDRKSTRLNSSHEWISYAVFCLKKKKTEKEEIEE